MICATPSARGRGSTQAALEAAIRNWCFYDAPFRVLAEEIGMGLTAEEQAQADQAGRNRAGYLGVGAAYWQYKQTGVLLNGNMRMLYWQKDWKTGEATYHQEPWRRCPRRCWRVRSPQPP